MDKGKELEPQLLIDIQRANKYFGSVHVLKDVNFSVAAQKVAVIIGSSGSGKSTLCRIINGLERISTGSVKVNGEDLPAEGRELARARANIGMVFQSFNLFPHRSILDNVILAPRHVRGIPRREAAAEALDLLRLVGVGDQAMKFPAQLSGGQQQRVAIARALAMRPNLMLFDEPTSALDPLMTKEVLDVMKNLASMGKTMVVVTHEMEFAAQVADTVTFMDAGAIVESSSDPRSFFAEPASSRARAFLSKGLSENA